jgi:hypothetical protein
LRWTESRNLVGGGSRCQARIDFIPDVEHRSCRNRPLLDHVALLSLYRSTVLCIGKRNR